MGGLLMPRLRRPRIATLQEVRIAKKKEGAIIEFLEPGIASIHLTIGPGVAGMNDQEILDLFNRTILAQEQLVASYHHIAIEIPEGRPQVNYSTDCYQWVPRGHVLRCLLSDAEGEAMIEIDGREFSPAEFSRMLTTFSGWGMRICFVPEDDITEEPEIEVREPENE
jgi:hypothetical protein